MRCENITHKENDFVQKGWDEGSVRAICLNFLSLVYRNEHRAAVWQPVSAGITGCLAVSWD